MRFWKTLVFLILSSTCYSADFYWVGGAGNWSDFTNHWATTSGGSGMHTSAPGITDNVYIDANSFSSFNDTLFIDVPAFSNKLHLNNSTNVKMNAALTVNDSLLLETGSLFTNGNNIQCRTFFSNYFSPRKLNLNASTITVTGDGTAWNASGINFTLAQTASTIQMAYPGANTVYFRSGGSFITYQNVVFTCSDLEFLMVSTFNTVSFTAGMTVTFPADVGNDFTASTVVMIGNCAAPIYLQSSDPSVQAIINMQGGTLTGNYLRIQSISGTNGTFIANNSVDEGNNTGWVINEDPSAVTIFWINGSGNWSDPSHWSTGCIPGPNNNVVFNGASFTGAQTVTVDINGYCNSMTWTGLTASPDLTGTHNVVMKGSMTLDPLMTATLTADYKFVGNTPATITTNGVVLNGDVVLDNAAGNWTLSGAFTSKADIDLQAGSFSTGGSFMTIAHLLSSTTNTRTLDISNTNMILEGTGNCWYLDNTNLTFTSTNSEILVFHPDLSYSTFRGGGETYNALRFFNKQSRLFGNNTFNIVEIAQNSSLALQSGSDQQIDSLIALTGCTGIITLESTNNLGTAANITKTGYDTLIVSGVRINNVTADNSGVKYNLNQSGSLINNTTGWDTTNISSGSDFYWVGGTGNWSDVSHWESPLGFAATCLPNLRDTVYFNAASFSSASQVVTIDVDASCARMDWTGSDIWTPELLFVRNLEIRQDAILNPNLTINNDNASAQMKFVPEGNNCIFTTFDVPANINLLLNGSALNDSLTLNGDLFLDDTSSLVVSQGTFLSNGDSISAGTFTAAGTGPKQVTLGNSFIKLVFGLNFSALTSLDAGNSHIFLSGSLVPDFFYGNNLTYYDVTLQSLSADTSTILTGSNSYNDLTFNPGLNLSIANGSVHTVNGIFLADGNCNDSIFVHTQTNGASAQLDLTNAGTAECVNVQDIQVSSSTLTALFSTNQSNNTGLWFFDPSPSSTANFTTPYDLCLGDTTFITNTSTAYAGGIAALSFDWQFDYTDTSTQQNPSYIFTDGGIHYVELTTTYTNFCQNVYLDSVRINDPSVALTMSDADSTICEGEQVFFNAISAGSTLFDFMINGVSQQAGTLTSWDTTGLADGDTAQVMVTLNGCTALSPESYVFDVIPAPVIPFISSDADNIICAGDTVTFTASGTDVYEFFVNGLPETGITASGILELTNLINGDYITVLGTDTLSGCSDSGSVSHTITVNPLPSPTFASSDADLVICSGDPVTFTAGAASTFEFFVNGSSVQGPSTVNTYNTATLQNGDIVTLEGYDLGCGNTATQSFTFFVNPVPNVTLSNNTGSTICAGETVTFTASGATTYQYFIDGFAQGAPTGSPTFISSSLTNGQTVTVTGSSNNCTASSAPTAFTVVALPSVALVSSDADNIICQDDPVTFTASGASTYEFFINGSSTGAPSAANTFNTTSLTNGQTISVKGYNSGCESNGAATFTMTVKPKFNVNLFSSDIDLQICEGDPITFTAVGAGVTSYELFVDGVSQGVTTGGSYPSAALTAGTPNVWATGTKNGCTYNSQDTLVVQVDSVPDVILVSSDADNTICNGETVTFTGSGAATYEYLVNGLSYGISSNPQLVISNLTNGQTVSLVGYANGCSAASPNTYPMTVNPVPTVTISSNDIDNIICEGDSLEITANGATLYELFMDGSSIGAPSATNVYSLDTLTGPHSVYFEGSSAGCFDQSGTINISVNTLPVITTTVSDTDTTICAGDNISFTASGGGTYEFFVNGLSTGTPDINPTFTSSTLSDGDVVTVEGTSANGCSSLSADSFTLTVNPIPTVTLASTDADSAICIGDNVTFTAGGAGNYEFFLNGVSVQTGSIYQTDTITNGDIISVIGSLNGCPAPPQAMPFNVFQYPNTSISSSDTDNEICIGEVLTFTGNGAIEYTFLINNNPVQGPSGLNVFVTSGLSNGDIVTVNGTNNGCSTISSPLNVTVHNYPTPFLSSSDPNNEICFGEQVTFTGAGALQYEFFVNGLSQGVPSTSTTFSTTFLEDGDNVTVIGYNGDCPGTSNSLIFVVNTMPLTLAPSASNVICNGENVTFTATGADQYEFFIDGGSVQGPSATNTFSTASISNGQVITVNGTDFTTGCTQTSQTSHLMVVLNNPAITPLSPTSVCEGDSVVLQSSFDSWNHWYLDGVAIPGANDSILTTFDPGVYTVEIAIGGTDEIWSVGANSSGQLGDSTNTNSLTTVQALSLADIDDTEAGRFHGVAKNISGTVFTWGNNDFGQLGNGNFTTQNYAYQTNITTAADIASGNDHVVVCLTDGTIQSWGKNTFGQLGHGNLTTINFPLSVAGLTNMVSVEAGANHTLALRNDGTVWAWGDNQFGQLGDSTTINRESPVQVYGLTDIALIACGSNHSMAVDINGFMYVWGNNSQGQLGLTGNQFSVIPVTNGFGDVTDVKGGGSHTLVLNGNNKLYAFGNNADGQLGDGTNISTPTPTLVAALDAVSKIGAGYNSSFAVKADQSVWGWGQNTQGQLGDETTVSSNIPVHVPSFTGASDFGVGLTHTSHISTQSSSCPSAGVTVLVNPQPAVSISESGGVLTVNPGGVSYQWYINNILIPGATNQSYTPSTAGYYHCVVTFTGGCISIADQVPFGIVGIAGNETFPFSLYPNPNTGQFALELTTEANVFITDVSGKLVYSEHLAGNTRHTFDLKVETGLYFVTLNTEGKSYTARLVVRR